MSAIIISGFHYLGGIPLMIVLSFPTPTLCFQSDWLGLGLSKAWTPVQEENHTQTMTVQSQEPFSVKPNSKYLKHSDCL